MARFLFVVLAFCSVAGSARAESDSNLPTRFSCDFKQGFSWSYEGGKFKSAPPAELSFDIADIDLDKQSASLVIRGDSSGKLRIIRALNANHYLEVANEGFLNLTTIYDLDSSTNTYPAVHSRHFGFFGQPVFSQYAGSCTAKAAR